MARLAVVIKRLFYSYPGHISNISSEVRHRRSIVLVVGESYPVEISLKFTLVEEEHGVVVEIPYWSISRPAFAAIRNKRPCSS